jgi:hypothetical protein
MESRAHRRILTTARVRASLITAVVTVAALVALAAPAGSSVAGREIDTGTDADGATVEVVDGSQSSTPGAAGGGSSAGGCSRRYVEIALDPGELIGLLYAAIGPPPTTDHRPYHVFCDDDYVGAVWAIPRSALAAIAEREARSLLARIEFPAVEIGVNPATGLAGLDSWFWIDGYDGTPFTESRADFGITIDLEVRLSDVRWEFGDGTAVVGGLGRPFPTPSDVAHTYERSGAQTVTAGFAYETRYRVNGSEWTTLDSVPRRTERPYEVRQVRSALTE